MTEIPENTPSTSVAVSVGRIEVAINNLIAGFNEFKSSHAKDIEIVHSLREKLEARVKALEDEAIQRRSSFFSVRSVIEGMVVLTGLWFSYHMGVWK